MSTGFTLIVKPNGDYISEQSGPKYLVPGMYYLLPGMYFYAPRNGASYPELRTALDENIRYV